MLHELRELIKLFVLNIKENGLIIALLKILIRASITAFPTRSETKVKLRNGCELYVIPNDIGISSELGLFKIHEPLATRVLSDELTRDMVVIDIGSNIGYYVSLESKKIKSKGRVIAIEPDPVNFSYLLRNIELNGLSNVTVINLAISNKNHLVKMIRRRRSNWSKVLQNDQDLPLDVTNIFEVQAVSLDNLIEQLDLERLDLIRMDVEGYEDIILNASENTLQKYSPDIFLEIHHFLIGRERLSKLLRKIENMGYKIKYFIPRNIDFELIYKKYDFSHKDIGKLLQGSIPDVFSVYLTTRSNEML